MHSGKLAAGLASCLAAWSGPTWAEISLDGSANPAHSGALTPDGGVYSIPDTVGHRSGANLFHSFSSFNLDATEQASFSGPSDIRNVISRVTGGSVSTIDGLLRSTIPGADFYFFNPSGVVFGPNASLDVQGSLHVGSADYVQLADGVRFGTDTAMSGLTSAPPEAFGFLGPATAPIQVSGSRLTLPQGAALSLVGGDVTIGDHPGGGPSVLYVPDGTLNLVSLAGEGVARWTADGVAVDGAPRGDISLSGGTPKLVDLAPFGLPLLLVYQQGTILDAQRVRIRAGNLTVADALISPGGLSLQSGLQRDIGYAPFFGQGSPPDGGEVDIQATGDIRFSGTGRLFSENIFFPTGALFGTTYAGVSPGVYVFTKSSQAAAVPAVNLQATGALSATGTSGVRHERFGSGSAGNIRINAGELRLEAGGNITAVNYASGEGATLAVEADSAYLARGANADFTGLATQSRKAGSSSGEGSSGRLEITARRLEVREGAEVSTDSAWTGPGGDLTIIADEIVLSRDGHATGGLTTQSAIAGDAGNLIITAGTLTVDDGAATESEGFRISATTAGVGDAGDVRVEVSNLRINGTNAGIFSISTPPPPELLDEFAANLRLSGIEDWATLQAALADAVGLPESADFLTTLSTLNALGLVSVAASDAGNAGTITVAAGDVALEGASRVDSSTRWDGDAGAVLVTAATIDLRDGAVIRSLSGGVDPATGAVSAGSGTAGAVTVRADRVTIVGTSASGASSGLLTQTRGNGAGGQVELVVSGHLSVGGGGRIGADTGGDGDAGTVLVRAGSISLKGAGAISSDSGITVGTTRLAGAGRGGHVDVRATQELLISEAGSTVSTNTQGVGDGGNVTVQGATVRLGSGGSISASSTGAGLAGDVNIDASSQFVSDGGTVATGSTVSDGGNIVLNAVDMLRCENCGITTSVAGGEGRGGNISIDPEFVILRNGRIQANAFGGPGGNISIVAGNFIATPDSRVEASSALGIDGNVDIRAPDTDLSGSIAVLPEGYLDATALLRSACAAAAGGLASSLVSTQGGFGADPDGYLPSYAAADAGATVGSANRAAVSDAPSASSYMAVDNIIVRGTPVAFVETCGR